MKKICALLIICSIGLFNVGCDKKKDAGTSGSGSPSSSGSGSSSSTPTGK
jgi:hypothetical protein